MIVPQTLKGGSPIGKGSGEVKVEDILTNGAKSYIVIEYSAVDTDTSTPLVTNGRCAAPVTTALQPGLRYVYTLTMTGSGDGGTIEDKLYPIDFTCTVESWVDNSLTGSEI